MAGHAVQLEEEHSWDKTVGKSTRRSKVGRAFGDFSGLITCCADIE